MKAVIEKLQNEYSGKKVLIVGLGLQGGGSGVAKFFAELGAQVTVTDKKDEDVLKPSLDQLKELSITYRLGGHDIKDFLEADIIFKGPSVPWTLDGIIEAEKKGIPIEMELSFFAKHSPAKIIGITGTRGKSTTTNMIYQALQVSEYHSYLAGGLPGISTISLLHSISENDWVILELPSWPLSAFHREKISPHIAVYTNFYPDHLNFYKTMDDYLFDKKAIYLYQTKKDYLVAGLELKQIIEKDPVISTVRFVGSEDFPANLMYLSGLHNKENAAIALAVAEIVGVDKNRSIQTIAEFKGLPYRQEIIGQKENVIFINDTTSTTPIATIKAFDSFAHKGNKIYLLLGGTTKNLPYDSLVNQLTHAEKIILLKGSFTEEILPTLKQKYKDKITEVYSDLEKAVMVAYQFAKKTGGYVLFSPAAPSFAMFNNEFHRGEEFNRIVNTILNSKLKTQMSKL